MTKYVVVETDSVGYRVFVPPTITEKIRLNDPIELYTHQYITENSSELYGFATSQELDLFEMLINISGVGPKSAVSILAMAPVDNIIQAILNNDPTILTRVSGIGRKTAERIIVELREPLEKTGLVGKKMDQGYLDALDALVQLGYKQSEARGALNKISVKDKDPQARVKAALKILSNK